MGLFFRLFQFHYDLILFHLCILFLCYNKLFQFHYDLILFLISNRTSKKANWISISLWSYSIFNFNIITTLIRKISISLWSYSINQQKYPPIKEGVNFNFIMILFYSIASFNSVYPCIEFEFHYDLILLINNAILFTKNKAISISLWSYSITLYK